MNATLQALKNLAPFRHDLLSPTLVNHELTSNLVLYRCAFDVVTECASALVDLIRNSESNTVVSPVELKKIIGSTSARFAANTQEVVKSYGFIYLVTGCR
jgi:hypothetical protein